MLRAWEAPPRGSNQGARTNRERKERHGCEKARFKEWSRTSGDKAWEGTASVHKVGTRRMALATIQDGNWMPEDRIFQGIGGADGCRPFVMVPSWMQVDQGDGR
eukprot:scaffold431_cov334-Pavlova_lutheri.AAC.53